MTFYDMVLPQVTYQDYAFSDLRGKVVLVDFFASHCTPCLHTIPKLKKLHKQYKKQGFEVVGVALERQVKQVLIPYVNYLRIRYPVLIASKDIYKGISPFGIVNRIPYHLLIDRCGKVRIAASGLVSQKLLKQHITKLLKESKRCK